MSIKYTLTDYQKIGSYRDVSIYARTFWGNIDFATFNIEYINKNSWARHRIKNSFDIQEIFKEIDNKYDSFYNTKRYENERTWHTFWNEDLIYWINYLEEINNLQIKD